MGRRKDPSLGTDPKDSPEPGPSREIHHVIPQPPRPAPCSHVCAGRGQLPALPRERLVHGLLMRGLEHACVSRPPPSSASARVWRYHGAAGPPRTPLVPLATRGPNPTRVVAARAAAMVSNPVHGLPFLPGTSFKDLTVRTSPAKPCPHLLAAPELAAGCVSARPRRFVLFPSNPLSAPNSVLHTPPPPHSPPPNLTLFLQFALSSSLSGFPLHPGSLLASPSVLPCCSALAGFPHPGSRLLGLLPSSFSLLHTPLCPVPSFKLFFPQPGPLPQCNLYTPSSLFPQPHPAHSPQAHHCRPHFPLLNPRPSNRSQSQLHFHLLASFCQVLFLGLIYASTKPHLLFCPSTSTFSAVLFNLFPQILLLGKLNFQHLAIFLPNPQVLYGR